MTHDDLVKLLEDAGLTTGWAIAGDTLILWEHDEDPPAPLVRPNEEYAELLASGWTLEAQEDE